LTSESDRAEVGFASSTKKKFTATIFPTSLMSRRMFAQGGEGVVVSGCPACRKPINATEQFLDHLTNDASPELIDRLSAATNGS
jgi:hypothetical protein